MRISKTFVVWSLVLGICSSALAMGGNPPAQPKEAPKYKLQVLKMEVIPASQVKNLSSKKVLMVIAPKDFHDQEYAKPREILESKGAQITVASSSKNTAIGMYGMKVTPDVSLSDVKASDYDAILFIGGIGAMVYNNDPQALSLAIEAKKNNKVIGAICIAPAILAKAGILNGVKATVSPYGARDLKKAGSKYTGEKLEIDGKIYTANGPAASEAFGNAIARRLQAAQ